VAFHDAIHAGGGVAGFLDCFAKARLASSLNELLTWRDWWPLVAWRDWWPLVEIDELKVDGWRVGTVA
tara:strand:+ start:286 stop:489 length:204 start_codon:yes stop_codon:yes gene_type:complete